MSDNVDPGELRERNKAYYLIVDAIAWSNYRFLDYWRRVWEINSRPYASFAYEAFLGEGVARATEVLELTAEELESQSAKSAELTERLAAQGAQLQHAALEAYRGLLATSIENLRHVQETTAKQVDEAKQRLAELQSRSAK
ncbi:MAG: hypothetical protein WAJ85_12525 [Candidatus Baltobacteraceae bacterium]|jgi:hypothetical protein